MDTRNVIARVATLALTLGPALSLAEPANPRPPEWKKFPAQVQTALGVFLDLEVLCRGGGADPETICPIRDEAATLVKALGYCEKGVGYMKQWQKCTR